MEKMIWVGILGLRVEVGVKDLKVVWVCKKRIRKSRLEINLKEGLKGVS